METLNNNSSSSSSDGCRTLRPLLLRRPPAAPNFPPPPPQQPVIVLLPPPPPIPPIRSTAATPSPTPAAPVEPPPPSLSQAQAPGDGKPPLWVVSGEGRGGKVVQMMLPPPATAATSAAAAAPTTATSAVPPSTGPVTRSASQVRLQVKKVISPKVYEIMLRYKSIQPRTAILPTNPPPPAAPPDQQQQHQHPPTPSTSPGSSTTNPRQQRPLRPLAPQAVYPMLPVMGRDGVVTHVPVFPFNAEFESVLPDAVPVSWRTAPAVKTEPKEEEEERDPLALDDVELLHVKEEAVKEEQFAPPVFHRAGDNLIKIQVPLSVFGPPPPPPRLTGGGNDKDNIVVVKSEGGGGGEEEEEEEEEIDVEGGVEEGNASFRAPSPRHSLLAGAGGGGGRGMVVLLSSSSSSSSSAAAAPHDFDPLGNNNNNNNSPLSLMDDDDDDGEGTRRRRMKKNSVSYCSSSSPPPPPAAAAAKAKAKADEEKEDLEGESGFTALESLDALSDSLKEEIYESDSSLHIDLNVGENDVAAIQRIPLRPPSVATAEGGDVRGVREMLLPRTSSTRPPSRVLKRQRLAAAKYRKIIPKPVAPESSSALLIRDSDAPHVSANDTKVECVDLSPREAGRTSTGYADVVASPGPSPLESVGSAQKSSETPNDASSSLLCSEKIPDDVKDLDIEDCDLSVGIEEEPEEETRVKEKREQRPRNSEERINNLRRSLRQTIDADYQEIRVPSMVTLEHVKMNGGEQQQQDDKEEEEQEDGQNERRAVTQRTTTSRRKAAKRKSEDVLLPTRVLRSRSGVQLQPSQWTSPLQRQGKEEEEEKEDSDREVVTCSPYNLRRRSTRRNQSSSVKDSSSSSSEEEEGGEEKEEELADVEEVNILEGSAVDNATKEVSHVLHVSTTESKSSTEIVKGDRTKSIPCLKVLPLQRITETTEESAWRTNHGVVDDTRRRRGSDGIFGEDFLDKRATDDGLSTAKSTEPVLSNDQQLATCQVLPPVSGGTGTTTPSVTSTNSVFGGLRTINILPINCFANNATLALVPPLPSRAVSSSTSGGGTGTSTVSVTTAATSLRSATTTTTTAATIVKCCERDCKNSPTLSKAFSSSFISYKLCEKKDSGTICKKPLLVSKYRKIMPRPPSLPPGTLSLAFLAPPASTQPRVPAAVLRQQTAPAALAPATAPTPGCPDSSAPATTSTQARNATVLSSGAGVGHRGAPSALEVNERSLLNEPPSPPPPPPNTSDGTSKGSASAIKFNVVAGSKKTCPKSQQWMTDREMLRWLRSELPLPTSPDQLQFSGRRVKNRKPQRCDLCDLNFPSKLFFQMHIRRFHPEDLICYVCFHRAQTLEELSVHRAAHFQSREDTDHPDVMCPECKQPVTSKSESLCCRRKHQQLLCRRDFMCEYCGVTFAKSGSLRTHLMTHLEKKPFSCNECYASFPTKQRLSMHLQLHAPDRHFRCSLCPGSGVAFHREGDLRVHQWRLHGAVPPRAPSEPPTTVRTLLYTCPVATCVRAFTYRCRLETHLRQAHQLVMEDEDEEEEDDDDRDDKDTEQHRQLQQQKEERRRRMRQRQRRHACTLCGETFLRARHLTTHCSLKHAEEAEAAAAQGAGGKVLHAYSCPRCHHVFSQMYMLRHHELQARVKGPFRCACCCSRFLTRQGLRKHEALIHSAEAVSIGEARRNRRLLRQRRRAAEDDDGDDDDSAAKKKKKKNMSKEWITDTEEDDGDDDESDKGDGGESRQDEEEKAKQGVMEEEEHMECSASSSSSSSSSSSCIVLQQRTMTTSTTTASSSLVVLCCPPSKDQRRRKQTLTHRKHSDDDDNRQELEEERRRIRNNKKRKRKETSLLDAASSKWTVH